MNKAGLFLKLGFVAIAATFFCSTVQAQSAAKTPGRKDTGALSAEEIKIARTANLVATKHAAIVKAKVDPKLVTTRGGAVTKRSGVATRICTQKHRENMYTITRTTFDKLPADRQQFIKNNSDKYTIID